MSGKYDIHPNHRVISAAIICFVGRWRWHNVGTWLWWYSFFEINGTELFIYCRVFPDTATKKRSRLRHTNIWWRVCMQIISFFFHSLPLYKFIPLWRMEKEKSKNDLKSRIKMYSVCALVWLGWLSIFALP